MNSFWIATIGTSVIAFALKYAGHNVPERIFATLKCNPLMR